MFDQVFVVLMDQVVANIIVTYNSKNCYYEIKSCIYSAFFKLLAKSNIIPVEKSTCASPK